MIDPVNLLDDEPEGDDKAPEKKDYKELLAKVTDRADWFEDKYWKDGRKIWSMYTGREESIVFNILYSNTETVVPATFSKKPTARVWRRFDEERADMPAKILQRMLTFCMDTNMASFPDFMTACEDAVLDAWLPGQGVIRVRNVDGVAVLDYVEWDKYVWAYCSRWEMRAWEAFAHDMLPEDVLEQFKGDMTESEISFFKAKTGNNSSNTDTQTDPKSSTGEKKPEMIRVWEVWVKGTRQRHWLCDAADGCCLATDEDPLHLENFFSTPVKPLTYVHSTTDTVPCPVYREYQQQAEELNEVTRRLTRIIRAIKVRGIYASNIDDIPKVFEEDNDNVLIPSQAAFNILAQGKGLDAFIWLIPIDKLMMAAKELYEARDRVKQTIYEILGIGDILRGVSKASETLGAQELKDKWGGLRINKSRQRTADFIRDGLRLLAECAIQNTPEELWAEITGVQLAPQMAVAISQSMNKPIPPMQSWAGVLGALRQNLSRAYLVDIETNSSVDSEATQEKAEMAEFMNALGQAMAGLKDLMMESPQGWEAGKTILIGILSKFDLGEQVAPMIAKLPPPQGGNPEQMKKMMAEAQKRMGEAAKREQANKDDESRLKEMITEAQNAAKDIERQRKDLDKQAQMRIADIELARDQSLLRIQEEEVKLQGLKTQVEAARSAVALEGKKNAVAAKGAANANKGVK